MKIVGIASGNSDTIDNKKCFQEVLRQFKFKDLDKIDKTVGFLRALVKLFDI